MRKTTWGLIVGIFVCGGLLLGAGLNAAETPCPDVVEMKCGIYDEHTKGIVEFTHKKHVEDYDLACGDCHHDKDGKPLTDIKCGDPVQKCSACHSKPGQMPIAEKKELRGKPAAEVKAAELEYHAEALHMNCIDCHKEYNKEHGLRGAKGAPTSCTACHPRN